ncbi:MAG TPA: SpoIIE family protein phosphatase [Myxococcaceae bacterium]|nr:SpoIIE family protein phosphatase [Myxococcaceae bacterium]
MSAREPEPPLDARLEEAMAFLTSMGQALFPGGVPTLAQATWSERGAGAPSAPEEPRTAEARLRAAEAKFRTLVEQIPAVVFFAVLGEGRNEIYVSPHIEQMLGFTQQEWLEAPFLWYWQLHPDDRDLWNREFARGIRTGGPFKGECRFLARDGRVVWVHGEARLLKDELGRPQILQGVAFDVTESKAAQEILLREATRTAKLEEELAIARRVQTSILPRELKVEGLEIAARMVPADQVGGDYYDVLPFERGAWLAIGDVSGHGLDAGLVMLMVQSAFSAIARARVDATPREVLLALNATLFDNVRARLVQEDHVTLTVLLYTADGRVTFAGAHEDLLLHRRRTGQVERVDTPGVWVGAAETIDRVTVNSTFTLEPGDLLVLYTDGVTEATNVDGEQFELPRLIEVICQACDQPCEVIRDRILEATGRWTDRQEDDLTVVVIRYTGPEERAKEPLFPPSPGTHRRFLAASTFDGRDDAEDLPALTVRTDAQVRLGARGRWRSGVLGIRLFGFGEDLGKGALEALLAAAHEVALQRGAEAVEVDVRELKFLAGACFRALMVWLARVAETPEEKRYRVRFVENPFARWQHPHLSALAAFAPSVVEAVEGPGGTP